MKTADAHNKDLIGRIEVVEKPSIPLDKFISESGKHISVLEQTIPKGSGNDIAKLIQKDIESRAEVGKNKYGERLKANNGRDALVDLYQELLDACMYLRQIMEEENTTIVESKEIILESFTKNDLKEAFNAGRDGVYDFAQYYGMYEK